MTVHDAKKSPKPKCTVVNPCQILAHYFGSYCMDTLAYICAKFALYNKQKFPQTVQHAWLLVAMTTEYRSNRDICNLGYSNLGKIYNRVISGIHIQWYEYSKWLVCVGPSLAFEIIIQLCAVVYRLRPASS